MNWLVKAVSSQMFSPVVKRLIHLACSRCRLFFVCKDFFTAYELN